MSCLWVVFSESIIITRTSLQHRIYLMHPDKNSKLGWQAKAKIRTKERNVHSHSWYASMVYTYVTRICWTCFDIFWLPWLSIPTITIPIAIARLRLSKDADNRLAQIQDPSDTGYWADWNNSFHSTGAVSVQPQYHQGLTAYQADLF